MEGTVVNINKHFYISMPFDKKKGPSVETD
jgi:hypothetical protein